MANLRQVIVNELNDELYIGEYYQDENSEVVEIARGLGKKDKYLFEIKVYQDITTKTPKLITLRISHKTRPASRYEHNMDIYQVVDELRRYLPGCTIRRTTKVIGGRGTTTEITPMQSIAELFNSGFTIKCRECGNAIDIKDNFSRSESIKINRELWSSDLTIECTRCKQLAVSEE
ncbi:hypothetical protein CEW46_23900 [Bacillus cereus]|nr:hypothetical protein CEW46_23900 [Bacillus cereus]